VPAERVRPDVRLADGPLDAGRPAITPQRAVAVAFIPDNCQRDEAHLAAVTVRNRGGKQASIQFVFMKAGL
jgi:hypothetical protein